MSACRGPRLNASRRTGVTVGRAVDAGRRRGDGRASAVAAGGRRMFEQLGVWDAIAADAGASTK